MPSYPQGTDRTNGKTVWKLPDGSLTYLDPNINTSTTSSNTNSSSSSPVVKPLLHDETLGIGKGTDPLLIPKLALKTAGNFIPDVPNALYKMGEGIVEPVRSAWEGIKSLGTDDGRKALLARAATGLLKTVAPPEGTTLNPKEILANTLARNAHGIISPQEHLGNYNPIPADVNDPRTSKLYQHVTEHPAQALLDFITAKGALEGAPASIGSDLKSVNLSPRTAYFEHRIGKLLDEAPKGTPLNIEGVEAPTNLQTAKDVVAAGGKPQVGMLTGTAEGNRIASLAPSATEDAANAQASLKTQGENLFGKYVPPQPIIDENAIPRSVRTSPTTGKSEFNDYVRQSIPPSSVSPGSELGKYIGPEDLKKSSITPLSTKLGSDVKVFNSYLEATAPENGRSVLMKRAFDRATNPDGTWNPKAFSSQINQDRELWNSSVLRSAPGDSEWRASVNQFNHQLGLESMRQDELKNVMALKKQQGNLFINVLTGLGAGDITKSRLGVFGAIKSGEKLILTIPDSSLARVMANKDANWILARMAGMSATNPALGSNVNKLVRIFGTMNIPATLTNSKGEETKLGE